MKILGRLILLGVVVFALLQFIRPGIPVKPETAQLAAPSEVRNILEKDCYSCHSDQRRLAWFDQVVPAYWLVRHDILTAREHLNFSTLGALPAAAQKAKLYEAVTMIQLGAMPLPQFTQLHPEAKVTPEELTTLKNYLAPWSPSGTQPTGPVPMPADLSPGLSLDLSKVQSEPNGFPFDPTFESWKLLSTTDRGDNNTFRFILGNSIAIQAAQSGNITPWPDGTRFAKIAWQQQPSPDGLIRPGKFVQVEIMLKDAQRFKQTEGWGWGRWRGNDLKPYGENAHFVTECTSCHLPVRGDDYVYTLPITAAKVARDQAVNNNAAALPATLPYQPLGWSAITMYVDPKTRTTATLYGNEAAFKAAHTATQPQAPIYPPGSVLALVTWAQREDPHWFGARIPDTPQSVEFVQTAAANQPATYRHFAGPSLTEDHPSAVNAAQRTTFIQTQTPAWLP